MDEKRYDALEQSLVELFAGQTLPSVIAAYPDLEVEIETAQLVKSLTPSVIPTAAEQRSRTRVLSRAMQLRQESRSSWGFFHRTPRLVYALVIALIFLLSWNGLVTVSAQAIPGDQLYPAKLTLEKLRLGLALNPLTHQKVEEAYQARRIDEVLRLLALGRVEFVQFLGVVEQQLEDHWIIDGIEVRLIPETIILGEIFPGMTVEVEGATQPEGWVMASEIHLQNFTFHGTVEVISETAWRIFGREVLITSTTKFDAGIQVGDDVLVEVSSDDFGTLTAREITRFGTEDDDLPLTETPKLLDDIQDESEDTPETKDERDGDEAGEKDDTDNEYEPQKSEELDEPDETDESDETDEPDEADKPDQDEKPDEDDKPDETDEPDEDEKSDEDEKPDESDEPND